MVWCRLSLPPLPPRPPRLVLRSPLPLLEGILFERCCTVHRGVRYGDLIPSFLPFPFRVVFHGTVVYAASLPSLPLPPPLLLLQEETTEREGVESFLLQGLVAVRRAIRVDLLPPLLGLPEGKVKEVVAQRMR